MDDPLLEHAREFTAIEDVTLNAWLLAENAGLEEIAKRVLDTGLLAEHYTSLLANDPAARTVEQLQQLGRLRQDLAQALNDLSEALAARGKHVATQAQSAAQTRAPTPGLQR